MKKATLPKIILPACLIISLFIISGCAKIAHMQELLRLQDYSNNKAAQEKYVIQKDKQFDELLEVVKSNGLDAYPTQRSFVRAFGQPVFKRDVVHEELECEMWLYRYATKYFDSEKVYLYFDSNWKLKDWEHFIPEEKEPVDESDAI